MAPKGKRSKAGKRGTNHHMSGEFPNSGNYNFPRRVQITRTAWQLQQSPLVTSTVTSTDQSMVAIGNQYANVAIAWSLRQFFEAADPVLTAHDQFRIKKIDVYATQAFDQEDIAKTLFVSEDRDDLANPTWHRFQSRSNTKMYVIRNNKPTVHVGTVHPIPNLYSDGTSQADPGNLVPSANSWIDLSATSQKFVGLKAHLCAPGGTTTSVRFFALATVEFRGLI